jgi:PAS domain S-box-containing protein
MKLKILIPISILLFSLSFLIIGHFYVSSTSTDEIEYATDALRREMLFRSTLIETAYNRGDINSARSYLKGLTTDPDIRGAWIVDEHGIIVLSTRPSEEGQDVASLELNTDVESHIQSVTSQIAPRINYDLHKNLLEMVYQIPLLQSQHSLRPNTVGAMLVHKDLTRIFNLAKSKEVTFAFFIASVLGVLSLLLWILLDKQIARPIAALREVTGRIASGDLQARAEQTSNNEIATLAGDINRMAESLQQTQQQLSNNLARLEASQSYGAIGTWEWNIDTGEIYWSDEVYRIFGQEKDRFIPDFENYMQLILEQDRPIFQRAMEDSLENITPFEIRHRIIKDGEPHWILGRGNTERDANGKPVRMLGTVQDITTQVGYESEIQAAYDELNYQIMALNRHSIVSVTDADGKIIYVNDKFEDISGYTSAEVIGRSHNILNSGHHNKAFWANLWNTIKAGRIWSGEIRNRSKSGSLYWIKTTIVPHLDESGKPDRYSSIRTDITQLKNAQESLRNEHAQLQAVTAINNAYLYKKNNYDVFQAILQTYLDYTHSDIGFIGRVTYRPEENKNVLTTLAISDISWDDASRELYRQHRARGMELGNLNSLYGHILVTGEPYFSNDAMRSPYFNQLPAGHPTLQNFYGIPLYYGREFIGMVGLANREGGYDEELFVRLIRLNEEVARIIHEVRLRQHNNRLLHAINNSSSEVFIVNPDTLRILDANPAACRNLGYSLAELKQLTISEITSMSPTNRELLQGLSEKNPELLAEAEHKRKDGSRYPVEGRIQLITDESPHVLVAIVQDISERRASEQRYHEIQKQLFQSQKMEALGHLTGGIAHDFNNMLASILGYSELSHDILAEGGTDTDKIQGYLSQVITASKRARDLITQMLSFSRTKIDTQDHITDVKPVISEVVTLLRSSLPTTMHLDYSIEKDLPCAHIQPVQLHQILMNLCINARDAMEGNGQVNIEASRCAPSEAMCNGCHNSFSGDYICIRVIDTGSGIPADSLDRIFEPFFTTKETGKGTGMGLSVVHGIVHANHGHIQVESVYSQGTSFMIYLPISEQQDALDAQHTSLYASGKLSGINAVIVDDDSSVGNFLKEMLELNEVKTIYFNDSITALEHLRQHHGDYDILVTDMTMPNLTGIQLSEELAGLDSKLPVIICSGYNSEEIDQERCDQLGIRACLTKPIDTRELLGLIADIAGGKKPA